MGFLSVNTRKSPIIYSKQGGAKRFKASSSRLSSPKASSTRTPSPLPGTPSSAGSRSNSPACCVQPFISTLGAGAYQLSAIERLPREILEHIFILSGNFDLPQTSFVLASKLSRTHMLEMEMVKQHLKTYDNRMPTFVVRWPFVTMELLSKLEFNEFVGVNNSIGETDPFVPFIVEQQSTLDSETLNLTAFMVERGCRVEDSIRMYKLFADNGHWKAIETMARNQQRADGYVVVRALKAGQGAELAIQLLRLARDINSDWTQIWTLQQAALEAHVPEISTYLNSG